MLKALLLMTALTLVLACNAESDIADDGYDIKATDEEVRAIAAIWVNQLGLDQDDPAVWRARLRLTCRHGAWNEDVALDMAPKWIIDDEPFNQRAQGLGPPTALEGAQALWLMTVAACPELIPDDAREAGPPGLDR